MTTVKVKLGSEFRRFVVEELITFDHFVNNLSNIFPNLNIQNYLLSYVDEENDNISIATTQELRDAIRLAKKLDPPILRVSMVSLDGESTKTQFVESKEEKKKSSKTYSNWAKKQLESESKKEDVQEHVVKICGVPFHHGEKEEKTKIVEEEIISPPIPENKKIEVKKRKKTITENVETWSEEQNNKSLKFSEDITEKTLQYSNQILEGTMPLSKTIYETSIKNSEMMSNKLSVPNEEFTINYDYDEIVNNVSSKTDEYSSNISRDVDQLSLGIDQQNESIHKKIFTKSEEYAKETLQIVDEKSNEFLNELDQFRSKINTDVNIEYKEQIKTSTDEIESKLNTLSTTTNDQTINISDNIAKNILSI